MNSDLLGRVPRVETVLESERLVGMQDETPLWRVIDRHASAGAA